MGWDRDGRDVIECIEAAIAASQTEEERENHRADLKRSWPKMTTGGAEPFWDKKDLIYLYEDINFKGTTVGVRMMESDFTVEYNRFNNLSKSRTKLVQSTFEHSTHNAQVVRADNEVKTKETLFWRTEIKKTKKADEREDVRNIELLEHYRKCNWYMPLLLGSQHNNRFTRNTKVYVLSGAYKGRHGTIIGHDSGLI